MPRSDRCSTVKRPAIQLPKQKVFARRYPVEGLCRENTAAPRCRFFYLMPRFEHPANGNTKSVADLEAEAEICQAKRSVVEFTKTNSKFILEKRTPFMENLDTRSFCLRRISREMTTETKSEFDLLLLTAVDQALAESLGDSVSGVIKACIPVSIISTDPRGFAMRLEKLTGGTKLVELKIMKNLENLVSQRCPKPMNAGNLEHQDFGRFVESCRGQFTLH